MSLRPVRLAVPIALLLTACLAAAQQARSGYREAPHRVVEGRPFDITATYAVPAAAGVVHLHCEMKNVENVVLASHVVEVRGEGERTFSFTAPMRTDAPRITVAVWLGEDWRQPLAPIVHTPEIRVITVQAHEFELQQEREAPSILNALAYRRSPAGNVAVLKDSLPGMDPAVADAYVAALRKAGLEATPLDGAQLANPHVLNPSNFDIVLLPSAQAFPAPATEPLLSLLEGGGDLIALGAPAFSRIATQIGGKWLDRDSLAELLAATRPTKMLFDFDQQGVEAWSRTSNDMQSETTAEASPPGADGTRASLHVRIVNLTGWDTLASPALEQPFPDDNTLTCFWAKGGANTGQLSVEMDEKDGSRWIATIPLETQWKRYALLPTDFKYWQDNPSRGRGGAADRFQPANAVRMSVGLAFTHTHVAPGPHEYWIDQIGTAPNPLGEGASLAEVEPPVLDTISPVYKVYDMKQVASLDGSRGEPLVGDNVLPMPGLARSSHVRPQGTGVNKQRKWRWVPLVQARGPDGEVCGTVATLLIHGADAYRGSTWASFTDGDPAYFRQPQVVTYVAALAKRMADGIFLYEGGSEYYACFDGERVNLGARVVNFGRVARNGLAVRLSVTPKGSDKPVFTETLPVSVPAGETAEVKCSWAPGRFAETAYQVTVELRAGDDVIDQLSHELSVWRPKADPHFITARDGDFWLQGRKWYPHGVNYMPSTEIGIEDNEYFEYWLDSQPYDPEAIERDLKRCAAMKMNMVSIFVYYRSIGTRNLLDILHRCEAHGLKVNLSLRPGTPLDFQWPDTGEIIRRYRLAENDTVFAYDLAWEPAWGGYAARTRWDGEWEKWIVERYGSIENAEKDWKFAVPRAADGRLTSPSDAQVSTDGDWRVVVAAYRRFLDDFLSKKHLLAAQRVKSVDPNHLLSFRMSIAGDPTVPAASMPYDFRGVAKSMDIMCPEGYGRIGDWDRVKPGWFTAAYARFTAPGRPIMWAEFGTSVWDQARMADDPDGLAFAARFYNDFYRMLLQSGANGSVCWYYPGGYRYNERSDFGIIDPDGTYRGVSDAIRDNAAALTVPRDVPEPDAWITVDRDATPLGLQGIYGAVQADFWRDVGEGKFPGLKSEGTGSTSANAPLVAVGDVPYTGSNPPKHLNAEFNSVEIQDANGEWVRAVEDGVTVNVKRGAPVRARASVGNIGFATWLTLQSAGRMPGAVYLSTRSEGPVQFRAPIASDTPYLGDAQVPEFTLTEGLSEPAEASFEMTANGRAWFGEKLTVRLVPGA